MMTRAFVRPLWAAAVLLGLSGAAGAAPAALDDGLARIQQAWAIAQYELPPAERPAQLEALATRAHALTQAYPDRAEPHAWEGIVLSTLASAKGGLGALGLAKQAKAEYEASIQIDPRALQGSALNSLGVLYYKVPGWPIGFGDDDKAETLLREALQMNPDGIDPNYFYADYLVYRKRPGEAVPYLEKALKAAPRAGREVADAGRRAEAQALLGSLRR